MAILVLMHPSFSFPIADALRTEADDIVVWTTASEAPRQDVECIVAWSLSDGMASLYPNLKMICAPSAGVEKLLKVRDLDENIPVTRVVDPNQAAEIAHYVLAVTLRHTRGLHLYDAQQARGIWRRHIGRPADETRIGVLGFGQIGRTVAAAFHTLGFPVLAWSRTQKECTEVTTFSGDLELPQILQRSDVLVCALPLTANTKDILNREHLGQLPRGAYVVNVGRGEHLVEEDLFMLLDNGYLAGAALDVYRTEPLPSESELWRHPKVLATPHIAAQASYKVVAQQCIENLRRVRSGKPVLRKVDRVKGY